MKGMVGEAAESRPGRRPGMNDSRSYYKSQHSIMTKDQADLKNQIEELKRENLGLKKSLFDLSMRHEAALAQLEAGSRHAFDLDTIVGTAVPAGGPAADQPLSGSAADGRGTFREGAEPPDWANKERRAVDERAGSRQFGWEHDLKGHTGAVYACRWSPRGDFLASGSFDKTVRIWSVDGDVQREVSCLNEHQLNVSDVEWSADSQRLISGSFDQTVKEWDLKVGSLLSSHDVGGLGQSIAYDPGEEQLIYVGTTHKQVQIIDRRQPDSQGSQLKNDSIVNTVAVQAAGRVLISGDQEGLIKTWDLRTLQCVHSRQNDEQRKPISHIEICHPLRQVRGTSDENLAHGEGGRYLGVNSYDNVMRVYDRWCAPVMQLRSNLAAAAAAAANTVSADDLESPTEETSPTKQPAGIVGISAGRGGVGTPPRQQRNSSGRERSDSISPEQQQQQRLPNQLDPELLQLQRSPDSRHRRKDGNGNDNGNGNGGSGGGEKSGAQNGAHGGAGGAGGGGNGNGGQGQDGQGQGLLCTMKGHKNKNWPIRGAFFHGENCSDYYRQQQGRHGEPPRDTPGAAGRGLDDEEEDRETAAEEEIRQRLQGVHESFLMATGSADNHVYVYDVGETVTRNRSGTAAVAPLLQQMPGHTDRVYAVDFHPTEAMLASCSADFTVKIWAPRAQHQGRSGMPRDLR